MQSSSETSSHNRFNPHTWMHFFFNFITDILESRQCVGESLSFHIVVRDPLRSPSVAQEAPACLSTLTEQTFRGRNARVGEIRVDRGLRECDEDGRRQMQTTRWRRRRRRQRRRLASSVCAAAVLFLCNATFDHNTRHAFPQHDAAATNVPARSFVASHRAAVSTSPSLFSAVACTVVVVPLESIYVIRCRSTTRKVGDRVADEANRPDSERAETISQSLSVDGFPRLSVGNLSGNSRGASRECIPARGGTAGKRKGLESERNSREIPIESIRVKAIFFALANDFPQGCDRKGTWRNVNPAKNPSRAKKRVDDLWGGVVINTQRNKREI